MSQSATAKQQLQNAFELFTQVSDQLNCSYGALQEQVVSLNEDLKAARCERRQLLDEIQSLQEEVRRSQRLSTMGQMTARLAHQIRTPLSTALLYASQLKHANLQAQQHDCFVERLLTGLRHLDHMINDMLVFARGGQGGEETVSVEALVEQVKQSLLPQLNDKSASWSVQVGEAGLLVLGQGEVLASVLTNLATNALDAGDTAVRLAWRLESTDGKVCIVLEDNGPGIAGEFSEKIFEPFFTTRANGTGLGLAVVRAVIAAHGGSIELDSEFKGGARFVIRLPRLEVQQYLPSEMLKNKQKTKMIDSRCV